MGWATEHSGGLTILPLPRSGGEGRGEGKTAANRHVPVDPLTLTLSPSEGERENIPCSCRPSYGFLSKVVELVALRQVAPRSAAQRRAWSGRQRVLRPARCTRAELPQRDNFHRDGFQFFNRSILIRFPSSKN